MTVTRAQGRSSAPSRGLPSAPPERLPSYTTISISALRAVARLALILFAPLLVLKDIVQSVWNLPADFRAQRLLMDGLRRQYRQFLERKRTAQYREPTASDRDGPVC